MFCDPILNLRTYKRHKKEKKIKFSKKKKIVFNIFFNLRSRIGLTFLGPTSELYFSLLIFAISNEDDCKDKFKSTLKNGRGRDEKNRTGTSTQQFYE